MTQPQVYDRTSIVFHWSSAVAIIAMWPLGKIMVGSKPPSQFLYSIHVGLGLVIAGVTLVRVIWVWRRTEPAELDMPRWERLLFVANHYVLYGLLAALSISGIGILLTAGSFDAFALAKTITAGDRHEIVANLFLVMFLMHVAGVIYYQVRKGRTLRRMGVPVD